MNIVICQYNDPELNLAVPKRVTLDDGRILILQSWTPSVSMQHPVIVTITGILAREEAP